MESAVGFFLVLFGCSDDMGQCQRLAMPPVQYAAVSKCQTQQDEALMSKVAARADYPAVVAYCVTGKQLAALRGDQVDLRKFKGAI